jgi:5-methylcytosine-specific restriction endonuclease McrA
MPRRDSDRPGHTTSSLNSRRKREIKKQLHARNPTCYVCGFWVDLKVATLEHIVPLGAGGSDHLSNLALAHAKCNKHRGMGTYERAA